MKWLDETAQMLAYPLRATWVDKTLIVIQAVNLCAFAVIGIVALIQWLCA